MADGFQVERIAEQYVQRVVLVLVRDYAVFTGDRFGDQLDHFVGDPFGGQVDVVDLVEFGQGAVDGVGVGVTEGDDRVADRDAGIACHGGRLAQLVQADDAAAQQQVRKIAHGLVHIDKFSLGKPWANAWNRGDRNDKRAEEAR